MKRLMLILLSLCFAHNSISAMEFFANLAPTKEFALKQGLDEAIANPNSENAAEALKQGANPEGALEKAREKLSWLEADRQNLIQIQEQAGRNVSTKNADDNIFNIKCIIEMLQNRSIDPDKYVLKYELIKVINYGCINPKEVLPLLIMGAMVDEEILTLVESKIDFLVKQIPDYESKNISTYNEKADLEKLRFILNILQNADQIILQDKLKRKILIAIEFALSDKVRDLLKEGLDKTPELLKFAEEKSNKLSELFMNMIEEDGFAPQYLVDENKRRKAIVAMLKPY